jgi:uncharacterized protein YcaQ
VGRIDARADRRREVLVVNGLWWEADAPPVPTEALHQALERWAALNGARSLEDPNRVLPDRA